MVEQASVILDSFVNPVKLIRIGGNEYTVYENRRKEAGDFSAKYFCDVCDPKHIKFVPHVLLISFPNLRGLKVCRSCICNFEEVLKAAMLYDCEKGRENESENI